MITVNNKEMPYDDKMTVSALLKTLNYIFPLLVVKINNIVIERTKFDKTHIGDNDNISIIHLMSGG